MSVEQSHGLVGCPLKFLSALCLFVCSTRDFLLFLRVFHCWFRARAVPVRPLGAGSGPIIIVCSRAASLGQMVSSASGY